MPERTWIISDGTSGLHGGGAAREGSRQRDSGRFGRLESRHSLERGTRARSRGVPEHPGRTLFWSYFLGPLGLLASRDGRSSPIWIAVGGLALGSLALAGRRVLEVAPALRGGENFGLLLLALMLTGIALGTAAWARSVFAGGRESGLVPPGARTTPPPPGWSLVLGLLFPGLGLHLDHRPGRAALAVATVGASAVGWSVLAFAAPLWTWNHRSGLGGLPDHTLESVYLTAAGLCALGGLAWLIQALDGMRRSGLPARPGPETRGDGYGLALLLALVVLAVGFRPGLWAAELDARAEWAHGKGLRWTPLALSEAARRLDPTRPDYALRVAALHEELGHEAAAHSIRADLGRTWYLYVAGTWERPPQVRVANPCEPGN